MVETPAASSPMARRSMRANRRSDTLPERSLRSELHRTGMRFRKDLRLILPEGSARPDIVFTRAKVAIFVDGCFWHQCPLHGEIPQANRSYWAPKLARNVERDRENDALLQDAGWTVLRFFEHVSPSDAAVVVQSSVLAAAERARAMPPAKKSYPQRQDEAMPP